VALTLYSYCIQTNKLENLIIRKKETLSDIRYKIYYIVSNSPEFMGCRKEKSITAMSIVMLKGL
jgi:hypothetical protein